MDTTYTDELYQILDELNSRVKEIVDDCDSVESYELIIPKIREKALQFVDELEEEIEKNSFLEVSV